MVQEANRRLTVNKMWDNKKNEESYLLQLAFLNKKKMKQFVNANTSGNHFSKSFELQKVVEYLPLPKVG